MRETRLLALLIGAAALAGCGRSSDPGIFFPTWDTSGGIPQALLEDATLILDQGCLFAETAEATAPLLLVWPEGFRFERDGGRVLEPSGNVVATVGETARLVGGATGSGHAEELIGEPIPAACRRRGDETVWLVGEVLDAA
jgi:hypothetical protein